MATKAHKKTTRRKNASRGRKQGSSSLGWFLAGLLLGLGTSAFLYLKGYMPDRPDSRPVADNAESAEELEPAGDDGEIAASSDSNRYDFFTVLPEMEVVVPDQELNREAQPQSAPDTSGASYILQAGSFQSEAEAEQRKARLALQGHAAAIQVVTVNGATWYRVRIGPVTGARRADEIRRQLQDNNIETLVLRGTSLAPGD